MDAAPLQPRTGKLEIDIAQTGGFRCLIPVIDQVFQGQIIKLQVFKVRPDDHRSGRRHALAVNTDIERHAAGQEPGRNSAVSGDQRVKDIIRCQRCRRSVLGQTQCPDIVTGSNGGQSQEVGVCRRSLDLEIIEALDPQ